MVQNHWASYSTCVCLLLNMWQLRFWFGLRQLCDVNHEADVQIKLSSNSPALRDQVELHDLTRQRVASGHVSLDLRVEVG